MKVVEYIMNEYNLCMGCMSEKTYAGPCKSCGYSDAAPHLPSYLAPETVLEERYIIGRLLKYNGQGAEYIAYDAAIKQRVIVVEFMPDTLCSRKKDDPTIRIGANQIALYKTYLSEFAELYKGLMKSRGMTHLQAVTDVFAANNTAYAVCEYIDGITLKSYLTTSAGELTWEQVKELFPPILTTLSLMHSAGIVHRGISPDTIFVTDKMELKLAGFAIPAARTANTEIVCELYSGYAAPEQYSPSNRHGTWTDVYGIAAVIYRVLTGSMPPEAISRVDSDSLLEPLIVNRNVPSNVSKVIMKGMELDVDSRTQTVTDFVNRLFEQPKPVIRTVEKSAPAKRRLSAKEKKKQRDRLAAIAGITTGIVLIIALIIGLILARFIKDPEVESNPAETTTAITTAAPQTSETSAQTTSSAFTLIVPDFRNRKVDSLSDYNDKLVFKISYDYSETYAKDMIFKQSIEPQTTVEKDTEIAITVSKGPKKVKLPDYTGMKEKEYSKALTELGIKFEVKSFKTNDVKKGYVAKCSKEIGELVDVEKAEIVTVYIAEKGSDNVSTTAVTKPPIDTDTETQVPETLPGDIGIIID